MSDQGSTSSGNFVGNKGTRNPPRRPSFYIIPKNTLFRRTRCPVARYVTGMGKDYLTMTMKFARLAMLFPGTEMKFLDKLNELRSMYNASNFIMNLSGRTHLTCNQAPSPFLSAFHRFSRKKKSERPSRHTLKITLVKVQHGFIVN